MDISSLLSNLSEDDISKLKATAAQLLGGADSARTNTETQNSNFSDTREQATFSGSTVGSSGDSTSGVSSGSTVGASSGSSSGSLLGSFSDMKLINALGAVTSSMNKPDVRSDFLLALKPLLSEQRRSRAEEAAKIIRLLSALPVITQLLGKGGII